jgi:hypothetical protein
MKLFNFLFLLVFITLTSCQNESLDENALSSNELDFISKKYNVSITNAKDLPKSFLITNKQELYKTLELMKEVNTLPKYANLTGETITNDIVVKNNKTLDSIFKNIFIKKSKKDYSNRISNDGPPYQNTYTFYFDNNYPCANVYITINYNFNSNGQITGMEVLSGQWGNSFGSTYSQNNVVLYFNGTTFGFELTGNFSTGITIGGYGMTNNNLATYKGVLQIRSSSSGGSTHNGRYELGTGWISQEPLPSPFE